jgi:four helix bundle protein
VSRACVRLAQVRWGSASAPLLGQLQRAAISVHVNIAEGYGLATGPQFRRHLRIAYGSALETGELLELGLDTGLIAQEHAAVLDRCRRSQRLLLGLLKKKGMKPS